MSYSSFILLEWAGKAEDTEEVSLWEDNWDDDIVEEEFSTIYIDRMSEDKSPDKPETSDDDHKYPSPTSSVRGPTFSSPVVIEETNVGGSPIKRETVSPLKPTEAFNSTLPQSDLFLVLPTAPTSFVDSSTAAALTAIKPEAPSNVELSGEAWTGPQRVSWNGETWTVEASDEENPFSDTFSSSSNSDTEPEVSRQESAARSSSNDQDFRNSKAIDVDSFSDSDVDDAGKAQTSAKRPALDRKVAQAIASKYRQDRLRKTIKVIQGDRPADLSSLLPGALVWTLLPNRFNLPWWPAVVVARPVKKKSAVSGGVINGPTVVEESNIRYFRVLLLCSASLPIEASMWLPQHRLRPFYGRSEFELFMRSQLANLKNKIKAIRHFAVAPKHQAFWHAARDQADAALTSLGKSLTSRFRFLGVHLPTLQAAWKAEDRKRKEALRQKQIEAASVGKNLPASISQYTAKFSTGPKKQSTEVDVKAIATAEQANKNHLPTKGHFICCVCLKPGHLPVKLKEKTTEKIDTKDKTSNKKTLFLKKASRRGTFRFPPILLNRPLNLKTVKPANPVKRMQRQQQKAKRANRASPSCPLLVPCSGRCSHFLHVDCINYTAAGKSEPTDAPVSPQRTKAFCFFCRTGLRQCSICMGVQPIANGTHYEALEQDAAEHHNAANSEPDTDGEGVSHSTGSCSAKLLPPMQVCSVSHCRRWFHSTCLRQQPFAALVRDGRAATFTCPAHTCMSCFADAPGTLPRPSSVFIRCYLCAATYHPGGWCVPAGSLELSAGWIICPRHALQSPPVIPLDDLKLSTTGINEKDQRPCVQETPVEDETKVGSMQEPKALLSLPAASSQETTSKPESVTSDATLQIETTRCLQEPQFSPAKKLDSMKEPPETQSMLKGSPQTYDTTLHMNDHSVEKMEAIDNTVQRPNDLPSNWKVVEDSKLTELNIDVASGETREDKNSSISLPINKLLLPELRRSQLAGMFRPANVSWCFICSKGGRIICCESCPASFHQECLKLDEVPEQFLCEDCMNGRMPRYGEIVWARLPPTWHADVAARIEGLSSALALLRQAFPPTDCLDLLLGVRWWPAEVLHDKNLQPESDHDETEQQQQLTTTTAAEEETPSSLREPSRLGFFPVRLFGLYSATPFNGVSPQATSPPLSQVPEAATPTAGGDVGSKKPFPVCLWTTKARVFPYEEGDDDRQDSDQTDDSDSLLVYTVSSFLVICIFSSE
ncbi:unnamed protein product [Schistocephalus solidus]|uniref:Zinc finger PHD-type domain-containing protein n=1 Tax=Schistocephalus solidus TaxID=70667 RepID=A0A3P7CDE2_SCHSO|nr:unnamed protein product [Schistocephalus solidus]